MKVQGKSLIIWRITDGRAGHDAQSRGLVKALSGLTECRTEVIPYLTWQDMLAGLPGFNYPSFKSLPDPDLLVGAGHKTHLSLLTARKSRGGKILVLMKPSLPLSWFDLCLIPEHDTPPAKDNILLTHGPLNTVSPHQTKTAGQGMILIGGPSRHYGWNPKELLVQIRQVLEADPSCKWILADSPRTPNDTAREFQDLAAENLIYKPFTTTTPDWLAETLAASGLVWVTADSMSMIYEALTAGAAVGILELPVRNHSRVVRAGDRMASSEQVTPFGAWRAGQKLLPPAHPLDEARRCARLVLERLSLSKQGSPP